MWGWSKYAMKKRNCREVSCTEAIRKLKCPVQTVFAVKVNNAWRKHYPSAKFLQTR